jgi:hypothetical protein
MASNPQRDAVPLQLYQQAAEIAATIRAYAEKMTPQLSTLDSAALIDCIDQYSGLIDQLHELECSLAAAPAAPDEACSRLRKKIREDLDAAAAFDTPCRTAITRQISDAKEDLMLSQKKKQISAYLHSPTLGEQAATHFDKRK